MAWPGHIKAGETIPAEAMINDIITACYAWLEVEWIGEIARRYYEQILGHALLDRDNHGHGLLRTLVKANGTNQVAGGLDTAWGQVRTAYDHIMLTTPTLSDLQQALDGIDHGGVGG